MRGCTGYVKRHEKEGCKKKLKGHKNPRCCSDSSPMLASVVSGSLPLFASAGLHTHDSGPVGDCSTGGLLVVVRESKGCRIS